MAGDLKYARALRRYLAQQLAHPDEPFLKFLISQVYDGRVTKRVKDDFAPLVKRAFTAFVRDEVDRRLRAALDTGAATSLSTPTATVETDELDDSSDIVTTEEEYEAFLIIKSIARQSIDVDRIAMRDVLSYCGVLLDDNNRKPICRFHFNASQKHLGLIDVNKQEERVPINDLDDIYDYADRILAALANYE